MDQKRGGRKILVVDDEELYREILTRILTHRGYDVATAADGLEALELLEGCRFDLLITDNRMPNMDGVTLISRISSISPDLPILLVSGAVLELGAPSVSFIQKPIDRARLIQVVANVLPSQPTTPTFGAQSQHFPINPFSTTRKPSDEAPFERTRWPWR